MALRTSRTLVLRGLPPLGVPDFDAGKSGSIISQCSFVRFDGYDALFAISFLDMLLFSTIYKYIECI
jgi:hypothetical protein